MIKHNGVKIKYLCGNTSVGKKISDYDKLLISKKLPKINCEFGKFGTLFFMDVLVSEVLAIFV